MGNVFGVSSFRGCGMCNPQILKKKKLFEDWMVGGFAWCEGAERNCEEVHVDTVGI